MIAPAAASHKIVCHVTPASDPPQSLADPPQLPAEPPQLPAEPPQSPADPLQSLADLSAEDIRGPIAHPLQQTELQFEHLQPLSAWCFQQHLSPQLQGQGFGQTSVLAQGCGKLAFVNQVSLMLMLKQQ